MKIMNVSTPWMAIAAICALAASSGIGTVYAGQEEEGHSAAAGSLGERLDSLREGYAKTAPEAFVRVFEEGIAHVGASGVLDSAKGVGDKAPDFTLEDAGGEAVSLGALLEKGPVVLTWYRGSWCPYCNLQLRAYQEILPRMRERGAALVALTPEVPEYTRETREKEALEFVVLSDPDNAVARSYGIVYTLPAPVAEIFDGRIDLARHNGGDSLELPLAATYVVDTGGVIRYAFVDEDYRKRAEPEAILEALDALQR